MAAGAGNRTGCSWQRHLPQDAGTCQVDKEWLMYWSVDKKRLTWIQGQGWCFFYKSCPNAHQEFFNEVSALTSCNVYSCSDCFSHLVNPWINLSVHLCFHIICRFASARAFMQTIWYVLKVGELLPQLWTAKPSQKYKKHKHAKIVFVYILHAYSLLISLNMLSLVHT